MSSLASWGKAETREKSENGPSEDFAVSKVIESKMFSDGTKCSSSSDARRW